MEPSFVNTTKKKGNNFKYILELAHLMLTADFSSKIEASWEGKRSVQNQVKTEKVEEQGKVLETDVVIQSIVSEDVQGVVGGGEKMADGNLL